MIVTPVPIPAAGQPLPDPTDLSTWAVRMAERQRWENNDMAPGASALGEASYQNALDAKASAETAAALSGATMWAAATNYATGAAAISPITYKPYIRKSPGGVNATDPSASSLWEPVILTRLSGGILEFWNGSAWAVPLPRSGSATPVSASGSSAVVFTGIPSWARRVRLFANGISGNNNNNHSVQLGTSAGLVTTGYSGTSVISPGVTTGAVISTAFPVMNGQAANVLSVQLELALEDAALNLWTIACQGSFANGYVVNGLGRVALPGALDRISFPMDAGLFDAGTLYLNWMER